MVRLGIVRVILKQCNPAAAAAAAAAVVAAAAAAAGGLLPSLNAGRRSWPPSRLDGGWR